MPVVYLFHQPLPESIRWCQQKYPQHFRLHPRELVSAPPQWCIPALPNNQKDADETGCLAHRNILLFSNAGIQTPRLPALRRFLRLRLMNEPNQNHNPVQLYILPFFFDFMRSEKPVENSLLHQLFVLYFFVTGGQLLSVVCIFTVLAQVMLI